MHPLVDTYFSLIKKLTQTVRTLLECKHLYQSIEFDFKEEWDEFIEKMKVSEPKSDPSYFFAEISNYLKGDWETQQPNYSEIQYSMKPKLKLFVPTAKLYCSNCEGIEAYNLFSCYDVTKYSRDEPFTVKDKTIQVFQISMLCQSCKLVPEVFLVRREGIKLTLSGRAPIETVVTPSVIPKQVSKYFRSAIVAHQSGERLAGIFYLRTFIEQWVKISINNIEIEASDAIDQYMTTLPLDFKSRFPSIKEMYSKLSIDIHTANTETILFDQIKDQLTEHFEARKIFKL